MVKPSRVPMLDEPDILLLLNCEITESLMCDACEGGLVVSSRGREFEALTFPLYCALYPRVDEGLITVGLVNVVLLFFISLATLLIALAAVEGWTVRWIVREEVEELALENCETGGTEPLTQTRGFVTTSAFTS